MSVSLLRSFSAGGLLLAILLARNVLLDALSHHFGSGAIAATNLIIFLVATLLGVYAIRSSCSLILRNLEPSAAVATRNLISWTLYGLLFLVVAQAVGLNLSGLLVGGAIVGVIVAAAAQSSLSNFFAGILLMIGRPYRIGASVRLRSNAVGGAEYEGRVVDINALYTSLRTAKGELMRLPNSAVVSSAMVIGEDLLQATISVEFNADTQLEPLRQSLAEHLELPLSTVFLTPQKLIAGSDSTLTCDIFIRSPHPLSPTTLADALTEALRELKKCPTTSKPSNQSNVPTRD
ncbi:MAG: mechanosensitive ion channel family protein [Candidatus Dormibacteraceae bacterium]